VPQARQRTIFVGVREDLGLDPVHPAPLPYRYSVRDALPWIVRGRFGRQGWQKTDGRPSPTVNAQRAYNPENNGQGLELVEAIPQADKPCSTIMAASGNTPSAAAVTHPTERRKFSIGELRRICGFPDDFKLTGSYGQQWERLGRAVPPVMMSHIAASIRDQVLSRVREV
jgi:DNA (cytosine-5)-methyltransferase 1